LRVLELTQPGNWAASTTAVVVVVVLLLLLHGCMVVQRIHSCKDLEAQAGAAAAAAGAAAYAAVASVAAVAVAAAQPDLARRATPPHFAPGC